MKRSEAQKKADKRYEENHKDDFARFQCKVRKDVGEKFKQACKDNGSNVNAVLGSYIDEYIKGL